MRIDLVSDFACPWCYVGRRRLAAALAERPALPAEIHWHPFELNPDIPAGGVARERWWRERFGSPERLAGMLGQLVAVGLDLDIDFDFTAIEVQPNTRLAHELMHLAARHARADELAETLFAAHFARGKPIGDPETLAALARGCGLPQDEIEATLARRDDAATVADHLQQVREAGVTSVPTFILDGRHAFSGAQEPEFLLQVLDRLAAAPGEAAVPSVSQDR